MKQLKNLIATLPVFALTTAFMITPSIMQADSHRAGVERGTMHVTKSPTCGCCSEWVALARAEGFEVDTRDVPDVSAAKLAAGVPQALWSCHTAMIDGYVIEGHVPFSAIEMLLRDRPKVTGISVPGMPAGSPGMGNDPSARYDVIAFGKDAGDGKVYFRAGP